ncbi:LysR family transcriptional regulator [Tahibacter amnicola]|uniref:LysR family transcriptional regulator n=1 Tax=Tahibacter amnicola TaxID=2976241 RepID=A0ABY6BH87_9GAMM|nr:LysR family transcriptional regulator [Tahibacter amnicola]UXI67735.1 LysR family transcriptional regulator [Tahibacter amnicola]
MKTILGRTDQTLCFVAVADNGSFTAAAEQLGCSKAHVSKQVAALERALGAHLIHRTTRRLTLTESGRLYLACCRPLAEILDEANRAVSALRSDVSGCLRISAPTSFGDSFLAELVIRFRERYPAVQVDLDMSVLRRDLVADGYDFAIRSVRTLEEHLVARPLGVIREVAAAAPAFLATVTEPAHPQDLARLPCVINSHFSDDRLWVFGHGDRTETVTVDGPVRVNNYPTIRRLGLAGAGVIRLPLYLIGEDIQAGRLRHLCAPWQLLPAPLHLVYPARRHQPLRTRVFMDFLLDWFAQPAQAALFR